MQRCFHPQNFTITLACQLNTAFSVRSGARLAPEERDHQHKPHLKFECHDCGFTAYYAEHNAPHWFRGKLDHAGVDFQGKDKVSALVSISA